MIKQAMCMALTILAFSGCQTTSTELIEIKPQASDGPGSELLSKDTSVSLFSSVCVQNFPNGQAAQDVLERNGFQPHPATGTFYDGQRNASFKLFGKNRMRKCSMVFASNEKAVELAMIFTLASAIAENNGNANIYVDPEFGISRTKSHGDAEMTFVQTQRFGEGSYYQAALTAQ